MANAPPRLVYYERQPDLEQISAEKLSAADLPDRSRIPCTLLPPPSETERLPPLPGWFHDAIRVPEILETSVLEGVHDALNRRMLAVPDCIAKTR